MDHYLNFSVLPHPMRLHIFVPSADWVHDFNALDQYLKAVLPDALWDQSRKLKLTQREPEPGSVEFFEWQRSLRSNEPR